MKILHTSDWHIGHNFFGFDRYDEFDSFFKWLIEFIKEHQIDILVISGDIFDTYTLSKRAFKQYFDFLNSIKDVVCKVIIIGGNHDSFSTLLIPKSLFEELGIVVVSGDEEDYKRVISFDEFDILAVSYLREGILNKIDLDYANAIKKVFSYKSDKAVVAMGHLTVYGSSSANSEREIYIGKIDGVSSKIFEDFSYVALGHIHKPQEIKKGIVYSGSPLQMNFGEDYQKKVVVIDSKDFSYEFFDVPKFREFVQIKGSFESVKEEILKIPSDSFVEIELEEFVDSIGLEELRRDDINITNIKFPNSSLEIKRESIDVKQLTPLVLIEDIFKDDEDLEEILKLSKELLSKEEDAT